MRNRRVQLLVGLLISALFLWLALRGQAWGNIWHSLRGANYAWLLPTIGLYFVTVGLRAWRWGFLLRPFQVVSLQHRFGALVIGYLGNNIYPFRIGEILRVSVLRWQANVAISSGLATLLAERVFDGLGVLLLVFVALPFVPLADDGMRLLVLATSALFFSALIIFLALAVQQQTAYRLANAIGQKVLPVSWHEKFIGIVANFLEGLAFLRDWRQVLWVFGTSIVIWLFEAAKYWLMMQAFPFAISFVQLMLTTGVVNLASILPSAPGFVGTFDLPAIAMLQLFDVDEATAVAYTIVLHAALWLPSTVFGFLYMLYAGLSWTGLSEQWAMDSEQ